MIDKISWEYLKEQILSLEYFNETKKRKIIQSIISLHNLLGEDIFEKNPSLSNFVLNSAPWTRLWFYQLSQRLNLLSTSKNFDSIIKRLKSPNTFNEGLSVIEIATPFKKVGFDVNFDMKVSVDKRKDKKKPDIQLINNVSDEKLFVEVTQSQNSYEENESSDTYEKLLEEVMNQNQVIYRIKIHMSLSQPRIKELRGLIKTTIEWVIENQSFKTIEEEGIIDAGFAIKSEQNKLDEWAKNKNISSSFEGPSTNIDEITRIKNKIRTKVKQIPKEQAGIISIQTSKMIFMSDHPKEALRIIAEQVYEFHHIKYIVVYGPSYFDNQEIYKEYDNNLFIRKLNNLNYLEDFFIIKNKFFGLDLTHSTNKLLKKAIVNINRFDIE